MKLLSLYQSPSSTLIKSFDSFDAGWNDAYCGFHRMYRIHNGFPEKRMPTGAFIKIEDPETLTAETAVNYHRGYESFLDQPCVNTKLNH